MGTVYSLVRATPLGTSQNGEHPSDTVAKPSSLSLAAKRRGKVVRRSSIERMRSDAANRDQRSSPESPFTHRVSDQPRLRALAGEHAMG